MSIDISQQNLREPEQVDWNNYNVGQSNYIPPPPCVGADGKGLIYYGIVKGVEFRPNQFAVDEEGNPYLNVVLDPIELVNAGKWDGYTIRFTEASVKPYTDKQGTPRKGNPNKLADFIRSAGAQFKPQSNADYKAAIEAIVNQKKRFAFTLDWEARNKETGEKIKGYANFPDDPSNPGQKLSVLKQGTAYFLKDAKGNLIEPKVVTSEVLFANAKLRYFIDPTRGNK